MLTIGQVARRAGIRTATLRYYESVGLLPSPARQNGHRRYEESVFGQLRLIKMGQRAGFSIAQIHMLLHGFPDGTPPAERWQHLAAPKLVEVQAMISKLLETRDILEHALEC